MKTLQSILAILSITIFSISCSKDDSPTTAQPEPDAVVPKIKTFTIGISSYTHTYDDKGRLLTRISSDGNKDEYVHTANKTIYNYYQLNVLSTSTVYDLNADGFIIKSLRSFPSAGSYQTVYTYNANKKLATVVNSNGLDTKTSTETYFYAGKSVDRIEQTFSYNTDVWVRNFTYYTYKINTFGYQNQGNLFYSEESVHPVKTITNTFSPSNIQVDTYSYEYDALGRINKRIINNIAMNEIVYY